MQIVFKDLNSKVALGAVEFVFFKNIYHGMINAIQLAVERRNPYSPEQIKGRYFWLFCRSFFGQANFCAIMFGVTLLPLSLFMIIW
jgi:drug/metabolite transporter (DMT)-like permease